MSVTPELRRHLIGLPGRCPSCVWHVPTMNHAPGCSEGQHLGEKAMEQVAVRHPDDASRIDAVLEAFAASGVEFSMNDLRPHLASVRSRNVIGARVNAALRQKRIREVGRVRSSEPGTHGHKIGVYRGA